MDQVSSLLLLRNGRLFLRQACADTVTGRFPLAALRSAAGLRLLVVSNSPWWSSAEAGMGSQAEARVCAIQPVVTLLCHFHATAGLA
jgi:hypothetical protein